MSTIWLDKDNIVCIYRIFYIELGCAIFGDSLQHQLSDCLIK